MDIASISVIGGLTIAALSTITSAYMSLKIKKIEYQMAIYKSAIEAANSEWITKKELAMQQPESAAIYPPSDFIIFYSRIAKLIMKENITEKDLQNFDTESKRIELFLKQKRAQKTETSGTTGSRSWRGERNNATARVINR